MVIFNRMNFYSAENVELKMSFYFTRYVGYFYTYILLNTLSTIKTPCVSKFTQNVEYDLRNL